MLRKLRRIYKDFKILRNKVINAKTTYKVPFFIRIRMYLKGFLADQYIRYDLKNNDINDYISEYERWKTREVNGRHNLAMDDKLLCVEVFGKYVNIPKNLAWINNGKIYDFAGGYYTKEKFIGLLADKNTLVIKPVYKAGSGKGVHVIKNIGDMYYLDEEVIDKDKILDMIKDLEDYIVVEFVRQHQYSRELFEKSTNTIRIISIIDKETGSASIIRAVHRIGVNACIPVDNGSMGALVATIDIDTGVLGKAKTFFDTTLHSRHPDTGDTIEGVQIPYWDMVKSKIIEVSNKFPYIYFMAWDVVITDNGFSVIEVNASSGLNLFQIWKGERNSELGDFYREHNIIK